MFGYVILMLSSGIILRVEAVTVADVSNLGRLILKTLVVCTEKENLTVVNCVKEKTVLALDAVTRMEKAIHLIPDSLSIVKSSDLPFENRTGKFLLADMQREHPENRSQILDKLLSQIFSKFVDTRSVSIKFPISALNFFNDFPEDTDLGRGKKDKNGGVLLMGAMMAGTAMALKMAALAAISGKALMTSMMAFMLAALAALKKHSSGEHHHGTTYEVINVPTSGGHGHHARSSPIASLSSEHSPITAVRDYAPHQSDWYNFDVTH